MHLKFWKTYRGDVKKLICLRRKKENLKARRPYLEVGAVRFAAAACSHSAAGRWALVSAGDWRLATDERAERRERE